MGIIERKQRQKELVRENILEAAWMIIKKDGWNSLSLRNIADAIEYSTPVIYSHFASKEEILREFYKKGFQILHQSLLNISGLIENTDIDEKIYAVAMAYWNFAFEYKQYYQVMFGVDLPCCSRGEIPEEKKWIIELFHSMIKEALARNGNTIADSSLKKSTFWCILHGLVSINITSRILKEEGRTEKVLDDAVRAFIKSLKV